MCCNSCRPFVWGGIGITGCGCGQCGQCGQCGGAVSGARTGCDECVSCCG